MPRPPDAPRVLTILSQTCAAAGAALALIPTLWGLARECYPAAGLGLTLYLAAVLLAILHEEYAR